MGLEMNKTRGATRRHVQSGARCDKLVRDWERAGATNPCAHRVLRVPQRRAAASSAGGARRNALAIAASRTERRSSASLEESSASRSVAVALARPDTLAAIDCSGMVWSTYSTLAE